MADSFKRPVTEGGADYDLNHRVWGGRSGWRLWVGGAGRRGGYCVGCGQIRYAPGESAETRGILIVHRSHFPTYIEAQLVYI